MLYPIELRGRGCAWPGKWGGKRESNPQPPEPQSGALPVELFPPQEVHYSNWGNALLRREQSAARLSKTIQKIRRSG